MALTTGQNFAGYEILCELGRGGMGAVYRARQLSVQRLVALKVLPPHLAGEKDFIARFQAEAIAAGSLNHPNFVQVYAAGESGGIEYIAMELVEGETIQHRLRRCGRLPLTEALDIAYHVATALEHAWQTAQLIHRDVKPDNIFLAQNGVVKLGDFGLAKILRDGASSVTVTGHVIGSPHFISPEQVRGQRDVDFRSDIYSLGCTLHYMMTGRTVFEGPDFVSVIYKHVNDVPPPLRTLLPNCPASIVTLLERMIAKDRDRRPPSYAVLIEEILRSRSDAEQWEQSRPGLRARARSHTVAGSKSAVAYALTICGFLLLFAAGFLYARKDRMRAAQPWPLSTLADPSDRRDFVMAIERLPVSDQVDRVMGKMRELNPAFTGKAKYTVEDGDVTELSFSSLGATNLWPLTALKRLRVLRIPGDATNHVASELSDLTPLAAMWIDELDCSWTKVEGLGPLAKLPIRVLNCAHTRVLDLSTFKEISITELDISGTGVRDISMLTGKPLVVVRCAETRVRDLTPLRDAPLKRLWCDASALHGELVSSWRELEAINDIPRHEIPRRLRLRASK